MSGVSPGSNAKRRRGIRHTPPNPPTGLARRNTVTADDIESEPDDPSAVKADDTFVELLEAAKAFMSLAPTSSSSNSTTSRSPPQIPMTQHQQAEHTRQVDESVTPSIPTSFFPSGVSSESEDAACGTVMHSQEHRTESKNSGTGFLGWLTGVIQLRVWQTLALTICSFTAGVGVACVLSFADIS